MKCIKCKKELPEGAVYCCHCGKKQVVQKAKYHKRANGTGTIRRDSRNKKPYIAYAPATKYGTGRVYPGSFATMKEAQNVVDRYIVGGRNQARESTENHRAFGLLYDIISIRTLKFYFVRWQK